jgi:hypothetical protein
LLGRLGRGLTRYWDVVIFVAALFAVVFAYGVAVGRYQIPPYRIIKAATDAAFDWKYNWRFYLGIDRRSCVYAAERDGDGVVRDVAGRSQPGVTFITTINDQNFIPILINEDGNLLHKWDVRFSHIWPDPEYLDVPPANDWTTHIHGALLYPNGDVVFNYEGFGLARVDRCAHVVWTFDYKSHHFVFQDEDGNLWVPGQKHVSTTDRPWPNIDLPLIEDFILKISPDGKLLKEISVLGVIFRSKYEGVIFPNGDANPRITIVANETDPTHLNDIEILPARFAKNFELFQPGDILVSLRNLDLLMVIAPRTETVRWAQTGPYLRQHDPDFMPNGHISVFDNRLDNANGTVFGGSRIQEVDPVSGRAAALYEGGPGNPFFTDIRGKQQPLANGNLLVTEANKGRAFEVTPEGETVWSYVDRVDEDEVALLTATTRYPTSYAEFAKKPCP